MTINLYFSIALTIIFMLIVPITLIFSLNRKPKILKICIAILFAIYLFLLFTGTAGTISLKNNSLHISFNFSSNWFTSYFSWFDLSKTNVLINLFMFFPLGFVVYTFSKNHAFAKTILLAFVLSCFIEFYQFALPIIRNSEISDIIFNTLSGLISAVTCESLKKLGAFKN